MRGCLAYEFVPRGNKTELIQRETLQPLGLLRLVGPLMRADGGSISPRRGFQEVPAERERREDVAISMEQELQDFRASHPLRRMTVDGIEWDYLVGGMGPRAVVLAPGGLGAAEDATCPVPSLVGGRDGARRKRLCQTL